MSRLLASLLQVESWELPPEALRRRMNRKLTRLTFRGAGRTSWEASYPNPQGKSVSDYKKAAGNDSRTAVHSTVSKHRAKTQSDSPGSPH